MNLLQSILLGVLVLLTVFNIYNLTIGRKKRKQAKEAYQRTLAELENKTYKEMKKRQLNFSEKHGYINDLSDGILLTFDYENEKMGLTLKDAFYLIPFSEITGCIEKHEVLEDGKWTNIRVELTTEKQVITLPFGSQAWKPTSTLASFILSDTEEFCSLVNNRGRGREEATPKNG